MAVHSSGKKCNKKSENHGTLVGFRIFQRHRIPAFQALEPPGKWGRGYFLHFLQASNAHLLIRPRDFSITIQRINPQVQKRWAWIHRSPPRTGMAAAASARRYSTHLWSSLSHVLPDPTPPFQPQGDSGWIRVGFFWGTSGTNIRGTTTWKPCHGSVGRGQGGVGAFSSRRASMELRAPRAIWTSPTGPQAARTAQWGHGVGGGGHTPTHTAYFHHRATKTGVLPKMCHEYVKKRKK